MAPIAHQVSAKAHSPAPPMSVYRDYDEKTPEGPSQYHIQLLDHNGPCQGQCQDEQCSSSHRGRHSSRLRYLILPTLLTLLGLFIFLVVACLYNAGDLFGPIGSDIAGSLVRRATDPNGTSSSGTFVDRKLYLIIIFVGLLVVVILGIMLSAWCCKGSFQNPLCCPCYLCACCGGLACLECIGCGLCAEGLDQV